MPQVVNGEIEIDSVELLAVFFNCKFFDGSWDKHIEWTEKHGSQKQKRDDIPLLLELKEFEEKHNVNLSDYYHQNGENIELRNGYANG